MRIRWRDCAFAYAIFTAVHGGGYAEDELSKLTLSESIKIALKNNRDYKAADLRYQSGQTRRRQIGTFLTSRVNVSALGTRQTILLQDLLKGASYDERRAEVQYRKTIYPNRDIRHSISLVELDLDNLLYERKIVRNDIVFEVKSLYWKLVSLDQLRALEKEKVNRFKTIVDISQTKQRYGYGTKIDFQWASVQLGLAQDDLSRVENAYLQTKSDFMKLLLLQKDSSFTLFDGLPYYVEEDAKSILHKEGEVEDRPEFRIAQTEIKRGEINKKYAKKKLWPDVSLTSSYNNNDGRYANLNMDSNWNFSILGSVPVERDINIFYRTNYFFGFRFSYDLFDGNRAKENYRYANSVLHEDTNKAETIRDDINKKMLDGRLAVKNALDRVESLRNVVDVARENVKAAHIKYRAGKISLVELLNYESDNSDSQRKFKEAVYDMNVAVEELKKELLLEDYGHN